MTIRRQTGRFELTELLTPSGLNEFHDSSIDVLIPAYNSEKSIGRMILSVTSQFLPKNSHLYVTVCANACKDKTAEVAKKTLSNVSLKNKNIITKLIITKEGGKSQALNRMLKMINNEIVILIVDDVFPTKYCLARLYVSMRMHTELCVIGVPSRPLPKYLGKKQILPIRVVNQIRKLYAERDITIIGQMCAFRKSLVNHFPNIMAEDNYLTYQSLLKSKGYGILKDGQSFICYKPPATYEDLFSQTLTHSMSGVQFFRKYLEAFALFVEIEEKMSSPEKERIKEDKDICELAKQISDCCWQMAVLADKYESVKGSVWKRVSSTL